MNLTEECDSLKVKLTQCEATIHELKLCLEQEKEGIVHALDYTYNGMRLNTPTYVCCMYVHVHDYMYV